VNIAWRRRLVAFGLEADEGPGRPFDVAIPLLAAS